MIVVTLKRKSIMYEDEGSRKWVVVIAAFFTQFIICGITYSIGIFHVMIKDHFNTDHFNTSWVSSILLFIMALSSVMLRFISSCCGPRVSVMLGGLFAALGLGLFMLVKDLYQIWLSFSLLSGIGFGLACTPSIMAVERYFDHGRFQALSVAVAGIGAGIITFPIGIRYLQENFGWRGSMLILAGIALNLCVCGALMKPHPREKEVHLLPAFSCFPIRHPLFHGMCIANLFWSFGSSIIYIYLPSYAIAKGTDFETTTFLVACLGMAAFISRLIFAFMGSSSTLDDITSFIIPIGIGLVVTFISPMLFDLLTGQIGYALLFGFYSGYWTTFLAQATRELLGPEYIALGNGYLSFMIAVGSLTGGPAAAALIQYKDDFKPSFMLAGACLLWSSAIMVVFKIKRCHTGPRNESHFLPDSADPLMSDMDIPSIPYDKDTKLVVDALVTTV